MPDRFASRRYSLKNKLGDRRKKQLLNSIIAKYRDLSASRRSIICLNLPLRQIMICTKLTNHDILLNLVGVEEKPRKVIVIKINLGFWETAHLPLPLASINTYFSFRTKCWLRGGIGGQFPRNPVTQHSQ